MALVKNTAQVWCSDRSVTAPACAAVSNSSSVSLRVFLHLVACIASLALGLRFAKEPLLIGYPPSSSMRLPSGSKAAAASLSLKIVGDGVQNATSAVQDHAGGKSSSVHPGRHQILIRPWPHPDPRELVAAQRIIDRVQLEQRKMFEAEQHRKQEIIVITVISSRCPVDRSLHLSLLGNSLSITRHSITWIVIEAGDLSNDTLEILRNSGVRHFHLEAADKQVTRLRIQGLRFVKARRLEGIIVFVDGLSTVNLDLFEEIQKVNMAGAFAVGLPIVANRSSQQQDQGGIINSNLLVQRPMCGDDRNFTSRQIMRGWERVWEDQERQQVPSIAEAVVTELYWSGVALNAKLLWLENEELPDWVANWDVWSGSEGNATQPTLVDGSRSFINDVRMLEPLGNDCGREVMMWISPLSGGDVCEFHSGLAAFTQRWVIHPPLKVVVPWKRTSWPVLLPGKVQQGVLCNDSASVPARVMKPAKQKSKRHNSRMTSNKQKRTRY